MTEVAYLFANGVRLARLAYEPPGDVPAINGENLHVFFELGDHLGSTSVVLDKATGELVERSTYQAYGGTESDYRPERWKSFREDYRFTGKEEDVEAGLIYFGKRFLNPLLNRWVSADPLAIHGLVADPNLYAYVSGRVLQSVDPLGLEGSRGNVPGGKASIDAACGLLGCTGAFKLARAVKMDEGGLAREMIDHFLSGSPDAKEVPLQLVVDSDKGVSRRLDEGVRAEVQASVNREEDVKGTTGFVFVAQKDYSSEDYQLALGGTFLYFQVTDLAPTGDIEVDVYVEDTYRWTPSDPRNTQCLHECGAAMVKAGEAFEFRQFGSAKTKVDPRMSLPKAATPNASVQEPESSDQTIFDEIPATSVQEGAGAASASGPASGEKLCSGSC